MRLKQIIMIMMVLSLLVFSGCSKEEAPAEKDIQSDVMVEVEQTDSTEVEQQLEEAVEEPVEEVVEPVEEVVEPEVEEEVEEETPEAEETTEEEVVEEEVEEDTSGELIELEIEYFKTQPESDWSIKKGDTISWTNLMPNYVHRIAIFPEKEEGSGTYEQRWVNEVEDTLTDETYTYTFNETGKFKWGSLTKFDKIYGFITVI